MAGRILVLDDEENYAEMLQDLLRGKNYRVDMATRPERAIDQLEEIPYDLVISDYKMPVMDGSDFLKKARQLYPELPFILVSGLMNTPELVKVANMSVTLVLEKPLDIAVFLEEVARFSEPMSEEEKSALAQEQESEHATDSGEVSSYPDEPLFFSAVSESSKRFMQKTWSLANSAKHIFIVSSSIGETELVAKDISSWRGNSDIPVATLDLPESREDGVKKLTEILSGFEYSNTISVRLTDKSQIASARELTESAVEDVEGADEMFIIYHLETGDIVASLEAAGDSGVLLPPICERPSDLATYARRFTKIASERTGKKNCADLTEDGAYLLLAYSWPGGYKEVQDIMLGVVKSSTEDEPISAELLQTALGLSVEESVVPDKRLLKLLERSQQLYLEKELNAEGTTPDELAKKLELDASIQTHDDLINLPLVFGDLAKL
jgi:DNA-binding NtrC family response regulator